ELLRAHIDLLPRVAFCNFRTISAFRTLERVTTLVELPRFRVLSSIFVCSAQREAEMIAINAVNGRRSFLGEHVRDLFVGKAISLEIGEAPVGVAEAGSQRCRASVGFDRFLRTSDTLQAVAECHMQFGGIRCRRE